MCGNRRVSLWSGMLQKRRDGVRRIEYALPNGQVVKFWDDNKIYLGNQLHKKDSDRCYGIIADEKYLMVSEYSGYGADAEIIVFKQWNLAGNK